MVGRYFQRKSGYLCGDWQQRQRWPVQQRLCVQRLGAQV